MPKIVKPSLLKKSSNQTNTTMSSLIKKQKIGKNEPVVSVGASDSVSDSEIVSPQSTNKKIDTKIVESTSKDKKTDTKLVKDKTISNIKKETEITTDKLKKTSLDRSLSQRPKPVDLENRKKENNIGRSANVMPQISDRVGDVREKTDNVKRPSRNR